MADLKTISDTHIRLVCNCGKFVHELKREPDGAVSVETLETNVDEPKVTPVQKKKKVYSTFFDYKEVEG